MRERDLAQVAILRQRAEEELAKRHALEDVKEAAHDGFCQTLEEHKRNIHDLEISLIMLQMQNHVLQEALEKAATATALYDYSPAGYFTLESDGRISELNYQGAGLLGKERQALTGTNFCEHVPVDMKLSFCTFLENIFESGIRQTCEIRLNMPANKSFYVYLEGFIAENNQQCLLTAIDITQRKLNEEAIRTSETRLKRAELISKTGNWELHLDTQQIYASDGASQIYGVNKGNFSFDWIKKIALPEYRPLLDQRMLQLLENNVPYDVEFKIKTLDTGELKHIRSIATFDKQKGIVFGVVQDITEQKNMEQRTHESEQHYRSMIEASPDAIVIVDKNGNLQYASHKAYVIFNIPADYPLKGSPLVGWIAPEMREPAMMRFHMIITGQINSEPFEYKIQLLDGSTIWTEIHGSLLKDMNGSVEGLFLICRDVSERKRTEDAMHESEIFFKQSQKAALIGSYKIDMATGIWKSSEVMNQIFGIDENVAKNIENWLAIVHPDDRNHMKKYFGEHVINRQNPFNKDYRIVRRSDGAVRWVHGLGDLEIDANGNVLSMIGTIQDITERKYAEEAVQRAHDELKNLHDNLDEAIFSYDVLGNKMLQASKAHEDIFGYPPSDFYRNPNLWYELIIPEDKPMVDAGFPTLHGGKELYHEFRIIRPDGQMRWIAARMQPRMNETGQCIRIDGIAYDITKRKVAEQAIRESEERFRMVFENVFDGIAIYEENDDPFKRRLVECNNQYAIMAGRPREELLAMGYIHHLQQSLDQSNNHVRLESLFRQKAYKGSTSWIRPDGKENVIEYIGVPITWRGKSYSIGIDRDVTERMQIEADLRAAKEKAEESDRLKSSFLANMSHEIRTPLNSIIGFSELMSDPDFDREQQYQFAQIIHTSGNNLLSIISDIMDISKIEAGLVEVRKNELSPIHLAKSIHRQYVFQAREKGIEFMLDPSFPKEEIRLNTDETKLRQIIVNLVGNSIKFTEKGFVELGVRKIDDTIQFHVRDTGIGISPLHRDKIFERFRQVESCLTRKYGGNGLGLAITKSLVELLGGKLWMESEEGKGSTFYFTLPL